MTKIYGSAVGVRDVTLGVPGGSVLGLLRSNGSGKSTTISMIVNLIKPNPGYTVWQQLGYLRGLLENFDNKYARKLDWLLTMAFGARGYFMGAAAAKRSLAGSLTGLVAFIKYPLIMSFAANAPAIDGVEKLSLFRYYNNPPVAAVIVVTLGLVIFIFIRGDTYQR